MGLVGGISGGIGGVATKAGATRGS